MYISISTYVCIYVSIYHIYIYHIYIYIGLLHIHIIYIYTYIYIYIYYEAQRHRLQRRDLGPGGRAALGAGHPRAVRDAAGPSKRDTLIYVIIVTNKENQPTTI